jgi:ABC-2 type transport system permease protein
MTNLSAQEKTYRMTIRQTLLVIYVAFEMTLKQAMTDAFILFGVIVQPLLIAIMALYMLGDRGDEIAIFVVIGSGLSGLWTNVVFSSGNSITSERWTGTLEVLVSIPTPLHVVVFGKNLAFVVQSLLSMVGSYILASLIFGYPLSVESPFQFIISIILAVLSFVSFGLMMAPLFVVNPDVQRWQNGLEYPVFILAGFLFPIALLPIWTFPISYILSPYWAAQALHITSHAQPEYQQLGMSWLAMIALSAIYILISSFLFKRLSVKARMDATLNLQ